MTYCISRSLRAFFLLVITQAGIAQAPVSRTPIDAGPVRAVAVDFASAVLLQQRLVVKFQDEARVRGNQGSLLAESGTAELAEVQQLAERHGLRFEPLLRVSPSRLAALESRALQLSGRAQPDLAGMLIVEFSDTDVVDAGRLERVGEALRQLALVEFAYIQALAVPPPGDISPATPSLTASQNYVPTNPGFDVNWTRAQGYRGGTVRLSDCEYGWNQAHEDLNDIDLHPELGQTVNPGVITNGWDSHGTAVVGSSSAVDNGYGITGIADEAEVHTYTEWSVEQGLRRSTAIANAIADSSFGDVVLLEMQTTGAGGGYAPAEVDPTVFAIVKAGADAGVIVVAAAGNGSQDLDSGPYSTYMGWGDSGAIIVGAGSPTTSHSRLSFSTYGSRVDVQGWGSSVFTLGYGDFAQYGGDKNQRYTSGFNGTSSASALVAPAVVVVQDAAETLTGQRLSPRAMRELLKTTGHVQGSGGNIGPFPDLRDAIEEIPTFLHADFEASVKFGDAPLSVDFKDNSFGNVTSWAWDFGDGQVSTAQSPTHVFINPGLYDVSLTVTGTSGTDGFTRNGYIFVDPALAILNVSPGAIPALLPGTGQDVTITGTDFKSGTVVSIDGNLVDPSAYTIVDDGTITLDMPQQASLGQHAIEVASQGSSANFLVDIVSPGLPALQIGNGDGFSSNQLPSSGGADVFMAGPVGEIHYVLYSTQASPSVLPGLISLDIGASFSDLEFAVSLNIPAAGWAGTNLPFAPTFLLLYFQSITLHQGRPIPVSNLQSAILLP